MKRNILITTLAMVFVFVALTLTVFAEGERYICISEEAVGFSFNKTLKQWKGQVSKAIEKYIVSKSSDSKGWKVKNIGELSEFTEMNCGDGFNESGYINCESFGSNFRMYKKTFRYIFWHPRGYITPDLAGEEGNVMPFMEIGKCSSF